VANVTIQTGEWGLQREWSCSMKSGPIWVSPLVGYFFYVDSSQQLVYRKSTNGGQSWGSAVVVRTGDTWVNKFSVWYDRWTPGDSGTLIHLAYITESPDSIQYRTLDTSIDSLSGETSIAAPLINTNASNAWGVACIDITKARNGYLYVIFGTAGVGATGSYRSTNGGTSFDELANAVETEADRWLLFPSAEADQQDIWCIYWDEDAEEISLKVYDGSEDSWAETSISGSMIPLYSMTFMMSAVQRLSDNHVILIAQTSGGAADLKCWDIGGGGSITAKTDLYTNEANHLSCCLFINQQNDELYAAYNGDPGDTSVNSLHVRYKKSADGGASWGAATIYNEGAEGRYQEVWTSMSVGDDGGRLEIAWPERDAGDALTNYVNSVEIKAAAVGAIFGVNRAQAALVLEV